MAIIIEDARFLNTFITCHVTDDTVMDDQRWEALIQALLPREGQVVPTHLEVEVSSINGDPLYFKSEAKFNAFDEWDIWDSGYVHLPR